MRYINRLFTYFLLTLLFYISFCVIFNTCFVVSCITQLFVTWQYAVLLTGFQDKNISTSYKYATIALAGLLSAILAGSIAVGAFVLYRRVGNSEYTT